MRCGNDPTDPESALAFQEANRASYVAVAALSGNRWLARILDRLLDAGTRIAT